MSLQCGKSVLRRSKRVSPLARSGLVLSHDLPRSCPRDHQRTSRRIRGSCVGSSHNHFFSTSSQTPLMGRYLHQLRHLSSVIKQNEISSDNVDTHAKKSEGEDVADHIICGTIPSHGKGIQIGQYAEINRIYTQSDIDKFGSLIGDLNPVHFPSETSKDEAASEYDKPIVHGMLYSSLFSTIFGTLVPGAIYRSQSLRFQHPVYVEDEVCGKVVVKKLRQINKRGQNGVLCTCDTTVTKTINNSQLGDANSAVETSNGSEDIVCISGEAQVWLPGATVALE